MIRGECINKTDDLLQRPLMQCATNDNDDDAEEDDDDFDDGSPLHP